MHSAPKVCALVLVRRKMCGHKLSDLVTHGDLGTSFTTVTVSNVAQLICPS